jgi:hypothetical protein
MLLPLDPEQVAFFAFEPERNSPQGFQLVSGERLQELVEMYAGALQALEQTMKTISDNLRSD